MLYEFIQYNILKPFLSPQNYPLGHDAQILLCATEEALGNFYRFMDEIPDAIKWYNKALRSIKALMEGLLDGEVTNIHYETKGMFTPRNLSFYQN